MKKFAILALSCAMVACLFAGCRRNNVGETMTPTVTTHTTTAPTVHTTQPTHGTTHATEGTTHTTVPHTTNGMPGTTNGTDEIGRSHQGRPNY